MYSKNSICFLRIIFFVSSTYYFAHGKEDTSSFEDCGSNGDGHSCKKGNIHLALPYINPVKVGHEQNIEVSITKNLIMRTLSVSPPIFEIPNFFSSEECELVIEMAEKKGLSDSPVLKDKRLFQNETTKDVFNVWDANSDGFVDKEELLMLRGNSDLYMSDEDMENMFNELPIDKNNDGKMDYEEFEEITSDRLKTYFDGLRENKKSLHSRNSQQTWLWHDEDELLMYEDLFDDYHERFSQITGLPTAMVKHNEPLQVVKYPSDGHYHCHYDSDVINKEKQCCTFGKKNCRFCRYLTVAVFLNDVEDGGELAFPVADNSTYNWEVWTKESYTNCNMVKHCSNSNLIIKPKAGTAVLFYNHLYDKTSQWSSALDPRALIGECQVKKGEKWIAYSWMSVVGDGIKQLNSWKMGSNWLSKNNFNKEVISSLKANYIPLMENTENRYTKEKNIGGEDLKSTKENTDKQPSKERNIEGPPPPKADINDEVQITTKHYDGPEAINTDEIKKEFIPQTPEHAETDPVTSSSKKVTLEEPKSFPTGPKVELGSTPAPLPLPQEKMTLKEPIEPKMDSEPIPPVEGHRVLKSIMLLLDELDQVELEIVARNLHSRLKLVCVPLMMNPMGTLN